MNRSTVLFATTAFLFAGMLAPTALAQCCGAHRAAASTPTSASAARAGTGTPAAFTVIAASMASITADPVNKVCPIKEGEVDKESPTREFRGVTIGFCCPGCEGKWDKKTGDEKMTLLAKHAPEAVTAIEKGKADATPTAQPAASGEAAVKLARSYLAACGKADVEALNALFLDQGRATVSENASDEGTWETYRDHHLLPELKEMPGFVMTVAKEDVRAFGSTSIVRHTGSFTVPDPNHPDVPRKFLAAVTYVVVNDGGAPKIAHLHWSSRAEKKPQTKAQAEGATVNDICPMTGDKVNTFHTREYNGLKVGFCDGDCVMRWDALADDVRTKRLADAIAGTTPKTPHGAQPGHGHGDHDHK